MDNLQVVLLVFFLLFSAVYASYDCPYSICGNNRFNIRFPFGLEGQQNLELCSYPGFTLKCNNEGKTVVNLPGSRDFYVRNIDYLTQEIQLYDPHDCLPRWLMNNPDFLSSSSKFRAVFYRNYTLLTCPTDDLIRTPVTAIGCLSNSTISTIATSSSRLVSQMTSVYKCSILNTLALPAEYESLDRNSDLVLTWDEPNCQECEVREDICGFNNVPSREIQCFRRPGAGISKGLVIFRIVALCLVVPAITCSMGITCYICFEHSRYSRQTAAAVQNAATATIAPQPATTIGLDDSTIESYTKVVLGESRRVPGRNHMTCPICLAEYHPKETVRSIPECEHCFHAECIDEWLKINGTCPLCRNNPSPSHINSS